MLIESFYWFLTIICLLIILALLRLISRKENDTKFTRARDKALDVLNKYDIHAQLYLASVGSRDNKELCEALDFLSRYGYIMTDSNNILIGKVIKARLTMDEIAEKKRAEFKLIDNRSESDQ